jgi:AcrR family transcriptional regulator
VQESTKVPYVLGMTESLRTGMGIRRGGTQYEAIHEALARGAARELASSGYADFTPEAVAERAGVSARTAFRHFETKLALALAGISSLPTYKGWLAAASPDDSFAERLRRGLRTGAEHDELVAYITATCLSFRETQPELLKALKKHVLNPRQREIENFLDEGKRAGVFRAEVAAPAFAATDLGIFMMVALGQFPLGRGENRVSRMFAQFWPMLATTSHLND